MQTSFRSKKKTNFNQTVNNLEQKKKKSFGLFLSFRPSKIDNFPKLKKKSKSSITQNKDEDKVMIDSKPTTEKNI